MTPTSEATEPAPPGYRKASAAIVLAMVGPFLLGASSTAAIVLGHSSLADSRAATSSAGRVRGRRMAVAAIALGWGALAYWVFWLATVHGELGRRAHQGQEVPLAVWLGGVWVAGALAAWVGTRRRASA